jgi:hypothetical protein
LGAELWYYVPWIFCVLIAAIMTSTQVKAAAIGFALAGTAFLWICTIFVVRYKPENPFDEDIIGIWSGQSRDNTQFFCEYNNFLTPVPVLLFIRVGNRQSIPATISNFTVEVELKKRPWIFPNKWLTAVSIPEQMTPIWVNPPPEPPRRLQFEGGRLEAIFRSRPLQPHETVSGWVLLEPIS